LVTRARYQRKRVHVAWWHDRVTIGNECELFGGARVSIADAVDNSAAASHEAAAAGTVGPVPKRIDPYARSEEVYLAVRDLVTGGGIEAVSVRAVAARAGLATSSLRHSHRDKDFLLRCMVHEVTYRFSRATFAVRATGDAVTDVVDYLSSQLPLDDDGQADGLVWLALVERARAVDDDVRKAIREQRDGWLEMSKLSVERLGVPDEAQYVEARRLALLLEAMIASICDPTESLDRTEAIELLELHARLLHQTANTA
jgi:AcrR family transcriptional regulator